MFTSTTDPALSVAELEQYRRDGFAVARGLFSREEVAGLVDHFMAMHASPPREYYDPMSEEQAEGDPLKIYPRIMHPHRFDERSRRWLIDPRLMGTLRALLGEEPFAAQSMTYFKPPGSRGQALHQDNFYLRVSPGSCIAAWIALDRSDEENGGLRLVPGTHNLDLICPEEVDNSDSFTTHYVPPPDDREAVPVTLDAGDVLFFNGSAIHGSFPNHSRDRWRRSFICHYVGESAREMSEFYYPLLSADGGEIRKETATGGGPCGTEFGG